MSSVRESGQNAAKPGFTVIEVMLFIAITGILLIGVLGGTFSAIATQRYNDSVRSFAEFLRQIYSSVISPESLGNGNSNDDAIYGKIAVFGLDATSDHKVYTATLVGDTSIPSNTSGFINELGLVNAELFCGINDGATDLASSVRSYTPEWGTKINNTSDGAFTGTVIIARSPATGTVKTAFTQKTFDLKNHCQPGDRAASTTFKSSVKDNPGDYSISNDLSFCLKSDNNVITREVRLAADGHNTSAVNILAEDDGGIKCH